MASYVFKLLSCAGVLRQTQLKLERSACQESQDRIGSQRSLSILHTSLTWQHLTVSSKLYPLLLCLCLIHKLSGEAALHHIRQTIVYDITFVSHIISLRLTCHLRVHTTALPTNSHRCIINDCSMIASFFLSAAYFAKHEGTLRNSSLRQGRVRHLENCFPASSRSSGPRQLSTSPETRKTSLRVSCKSSHTLRICPLPNLVGNCNRYRCQCRCYRSPTSLSPSSGFQEGM